MVTLTLTCSHCTSPDVMRFGHTRTGKQRYRCQACGRTFCDNPAPRQTDPTRKEQILAAYEERAARRGVARVFGVSRNTLAGWLKKHTRLPPLTTTLLPAQEPETLELDEMWSFVGFRKNKCWIWLALCRRTRQVVAYAIGDRSEATCRVLWERVPDTYKGGLVYTDFWEAYQKVVPDAQHQAVGKDSGQTNHVERFNNTLRQRLARFVRKTLSFSKTDALHECCLRLFLHSYNAVRYKQAQQSANNST